MRKITIYIQQARNNISFFLRLTKNQWQKSFVMLESTTVVVKSRVQKNNLNGFLF